MYFPKLCLASLCLSMHQLLECKTDKDKATFHIKNIQISIELDVIQITS